MLRLQRDRLQEQKKRSGAKARLLQTVGYRSDNPHALESDLRAQHLSLDVTRTHETGDGVYEIEGPIKTPSRKSVWRRMSGPLIAQVR